MDWRGVVLSLDVIGKYSVNQIYEVVELVGTTLFSRFAEMFYTLNMFTQQRSSMQLSANLLLFDYFRIHS